MGSGDFLGIHIRLVEDDGGIESRVNFEVTVETFGARNIAFGAKQRRRSATGEGEGLALAVVLIGRGVENLHGLAQVIHDDDCMIEKISAQNAVSSLTRSLRKILARDHGQGAQVQAQSRHDQLSPIDGLRWSDCQTQFLGASRLDGSFLCGGIQFKKRRAASVDSNRNKNQIVNEQRGNLRSVRKLGLRSGLRIWRSRRLRTKR